MKKTLLTAFLYASIAMNSQTTPVVGWVNAIGGNNLTGIAAEDPTKCTADAIKGIVEDGFSNAYVIGNYSGTFTVAIYTPAAGSGTATGIPVTKTLTSAGGQDVFLARYDKFGKCTWATSIGGAGYDEGNAICFTGSPATPTEFYITGKFALSMNIGANVLVSPNAFTDAFLIKYSAGLAVTPAATWWKNLGGGPETNGLGVAANATNVYITGYYTEWLDNPTTMTLYSQKTKLDGTTSTFTTSTPGYLEFPSRDMYIARFSSTGVFSDVLGSYRSDEQIESHGISLRGTDVYITGTYKGNIKLNSSTTTITCSGISDIFVARYPAAFTTSGGTIRPLATNAVKAGGSSTLYQSAVGNLPQRPDGAFGITTTNDGVFITGRFLDNATFGSTLVDPVIGDFDISYMFLARYDLSLTNTPKLFTGTEKQSEGYGIYSVYAGGISTLFVTGFALSDSKINGVKVKNNTNSPEYSGFVTRIAYNAGISNFDITNVGNFTDGITQNLNGFDGAGGVGLSFNVNSRGYALSYRVGCGVRIAGAYYAKTHFGNYVKTVSGKSDGFLIVRENLTTITSNTNVCGSGLVTLTGTGIAPFAWTTTSGALLATTNTLNVTPVVNSYTTVLFSTTNVAGCPTYTTPVTLFDYPSSSLVNAGLDICISNGGAAQLIGSPALLGATYSWAPALGLNSTTIAMPSANPATTTNYTVTMTDKCGNVSTDVVTVVRMMFCPHSMINTNVININATGSTLNIYPNPTTNEFSLTMDNENEKTILLYDYTGRIIFQKNNVVDTKINIDLKNEASGIYFVKVINGENAQTMKLIKE